MGNKFYNLDLPRLIDSITKLTTAIEKYNSIKEKELKENKIQSLKRGKSPISENTPRWTIINYWALIKMPVRMRLKKLIVN